MSRKEFILLVGVLLILFAAQFIIMSGKKNDNQCQYTIDSLNGEISTLQIDKGRYEVILERVNEIDSNVYEQAMKNIE